ncbi:thiol reductant ABC exporter subunit CydC [Chromohalobacter israelensis]|uniref:thiol reductant ABC exporter subunit CydC n=1 Tax=Chromohalobacter israelensis TaxID=141390 RepID=UPI000D717C1F|nr:thiol reductant ABC exporter subunit CydC [Chromohalobacter salexigens]PWW36499.1 ATP-binding cassette subfamily C protein CydC [Chromohalobacter salexigens]
MTEPRMPTSRSPGAGLKALGPWLRVMAQRRTRLAIGALLMLSTMAFAIGLLTLSGWFITATALTGMALAAGVAATLDVFTPGSGIRLFAVGRTASRYAERLYNHDTVLRLLADIRGWTFAGLARLPGRELARYRAGEWLNRLTADIDALDNLYLRLLAPPLVGLLAILGVAGVLALALPRLGIVLLAVLLPLWGVITLGMALAGRRPSARRIETLERLRVRALEHLQGLAELRAFAALGAHRGTLETTQRRLLDDQRRLGRRAALGSALVTLGVQGAGVGILCLALLAFTAGELSAPVASMLPLAVLALNEGLAMLPAAFVQLGATRQAAARLNDQAALSSVEEGTHAWPLAPGEAPEVVFDDVSLRYPGMESTPALAHLDLQLAAGERLAVLGPSGSGKSSLAQLVARAFDPSDGHVRVAGRDVRDLAPVALRARLGYLTQHTELFHASLADNLRLGLPVDHGLGEEAIERALWQALWIVDLDGWARELPQGLETWVGEAGRQLSGGQARRVALARVILRDAPLVLLDEPLAGLDEATAGIVAERLDTWLDGRSVLMFAHRRDALPRCDRAWSFTAAA